ncbi:DsbA family protein, partial [Patescibacteria group bacterium]|nr:DsbA family protein [Patescibacteria group bacterium]
QDKYEAEQAAAAAPKYVEQDMSGNGAMEGSKDAPVTMVEFSDFECPYCGRYSTDTYKQIKENYVDTGKIKYVFRNLPLGFHAGAYPAALAAQCVRDQLGDSAFFEMHNAIYADQSVLQGDAAAGLKKLALEVGVNGDAYDGCIATDKFKEEITKDTADAASIGINGTPGFVVGGKIISGAQPYAVFEAAIEEALNR